MSLRHAFYFDIIGGLIMQLADIAGSGGRQLLSVATVTATVPKGFCAGFQKATDA